MLSAYKRRLLTSNYDPSLADDYFMLWILDFHPSRQLVGSHTPPWNQPKNMLSFVRNGLGGINESTISLQYFDLANMQAPRQTYFIPEENKFADTVVISNGEHDYVLMFWSNKPDVQPVFTSILETVAFVID